MLYLAIWREANFPGWNRRMTELLYHPRPSAELIELRQFVRRWYSENPHREVKPVLVLAARTMILRCAV